jgi:peptide/nickel transport system permease protein
MARSLYVWSNAGLLALIVAAAALAPFVAPYGATEIRSDPWLAWSATHWLGTDNLGRDLLTRLLYGTRNTLAIAFAATALSFAIGVTLAFAAAVFRGWVDQLISRSVDIVMSVPTLIFALVVLSVLGTAVPVLIAVMAALDATRVFRLARALAVDVMAMDYVEAARLRGEGFGWFLRREILPNTAAPLAAEFGLRFSFACLFLSSLSFLGLGIQPPHADLGGMVKENVNAITFGLAVPLVPAAVIAAVTLSANALVDAYVRQGGSAAVVRQ